MSASDASREEGNKIFRSIKFDGMAPAMITGRLEDAGKLYMRALQQAKNPVESCKASKNLATVYSKLSVRQPSDKNDTAMYYFRMSFEAIKGALEKAEEANMSLEWISQMKQLQMDNVQRFITEFLIKSVPKIALRERYCAALKNLNLLSDELMAYVHHAETRFLFNHAVQLREIEDHMGAKNFLEKTYTPMSLYQDQHRLNPLDFDEQELYDLEESIRLEKEDCENRILYIRAVRLLNEAFNDDEYFKIDKLWDAADLLRTAITDIRCLETECMIRSQMAKLYKNHLGLKAKAKLHAKFVVVQAAGAFVPRIVAITEWYSLAVTILKEIQAEIRQKEEKNWDVMREPFFWDLSKEREELNAVEDNVKSLLLHVYDKHPPKNESHVLQKALLLDPTNNPKLLQKAIVHYHPDKMPTDTDEQIKWKVLCEEITKRLTNRYSIYTCV